LNKSGIVSDQQGSARTAGILPSAMRVQSRSGTSATAGERCGFLHAVDNSIIGIRQPIKIERQSSTTQWALPTGGTMRNRCFAAILAGILAVVNLLPMSAFAAPSLTKLIISAKEITLEIGDTYLLTATGVYSDNSTQNVTIYADWNSEHPSVATIYNGTVTAKSEGTTSIVVSYMGETQTAIVKVTKKVKALTKDTQKLDLRKNGTATIGLTATYSDNTVENVTDKAEWTSSDERVATVVNGVVTGHRSGVAVITAHYGKKSVSVETNVEIVSRLEASESQISLLLQGEESVTLTAVYPDGSKRDVTGEAEWTSSDERVADIVNGVVKGHQSGTATLTASYGTKTASIRVDVDKTIKLDVDEENVFLRVNGTKQLKLTAQNAQGQTSDVTATATWQSSNESVAYVNKGRITGNKSGTAIITATYNGKSVQTTVDVEVARRLDISDTKLVMRSDDTSHVTLTATFADGSTENVTDKASWRSDNEDVAYASKGAITAYKAGTATITGSYGGKSATVNVYVDIPSALVTSSKNIYLEIGEQFEADAIAVYEDEVETVVTDEAQWRTSDEDIVTVEKGVLTGVASGTADVTAVYGGRSVVLKVYVSQAKRLEADKIKLSLVAGASESVRLTATYADGSVKDVTHLAKWTSSNEAVADVTEGVVKGYGSGTATIAAEYGSKSVTIQVDVDKTANLTISEQNVWLRINGTKQLQLTVHYADGRTADVTDKADWSSSDESVAFVSDGLIKAYRSGTAIIKAQYNGKTVQTAVDVETARNLDITPDKLEMRANEIAALQVIATYADGTKENVTSRAVWSSDKEEVALVSNGQVTAGKMGEATIKATFGGKTATVSVSVDLPTRLTVSSQTVNLEVNGEQQVVATAFYPDNRSEVVTNQATWSTAKEAVATVRNGRIIGLSEGTTTITVTYGGLTTKLTVNVGLSEELEVSTRLVTLSGSDSQQVTLHATDANGVRRDVTAEAKWQSSKPTVADVRKGLIQAYSKGTATITATYGGKSIAITVQVDQVARIEASQPSVSLKSGKGAQVNITVHFNDGKSKDVTAEAVWETANFRVATVKGGYITAAGPGKTTITAKYAGKSVKIAVDVDTLKYLETSEVNLVLKVGQQVQVKALATYMDLTEEDVTIPALWESSKITVASAKDGIIKANGKGKATITVSFGDKKTKIAVEVK
jgi:hypothetical protein